MTRAALANARHELGCLLTALALVVLVPLAVGLSVWTAVRLPDDPQD